MKVFIALFFCTLITITGILFLASPNQRAAANAETVIPANECTGDNLLNNPSFEGQYSSYQLSGYDDWRIGDCNTLSCGRAQMAPGWHPYWRMDGRYQPWDNIMPEYKPSTPAETPPRVRSGEKSQHYFSFWSTHEAGMYQQVTAVPGGQYCASVWGHAWSDYSSSDFLSGHPDNDGDLYQRIGIDPTGGTDWQSPNIIWGEMRQQYDVFGLFLVEAVAQADTITVFTWSKPWIPAKHNDVYWDDAKLTLAPYGQVTNTSIAILADVDEPGTFSQTVAIEIVGNVSWAATLDPAGTIVPTLSQTSGSQSTQLEVTVNTNGLGTGSYETTLTIKFNPKQGTAVSIPIHVLIVPEVEKVFLPLVIR